MATTLNFSTFREDPVDLEEMKQGIESLRTKANDKTNPSERPKVLLMLGAYERIIGEYDESVGHLATARDLFFQMGQLDLAVGADLRLAVTLHWKGDWEQAEAIFTKSLDKIQSKAIEKKTNLLEYLYLNYGKFLADKKYYDRSLKLLAEALQLKIASGDTDAIGQIQKMMSAVSEKKNP